VGSLLKPFVYLLALATPEQYSLASYVDDSPVTVDLGRGKKWNPGNSDGRSHGSVRLIDALAMSYNQATVRVGMKIAPERIADLIRTLAGIQAEPRPSLILGAVDQSPYAMAQLYQFLASGGQVQPLYAVRGVLDASGRAIKRYDVKPAPAQEGDAIAARLITIAGQQTVTSGTAAPLMRDGLGRLNAAGKTGTSNDGRDSWFAGWTGDHLAVVWVGNDQNKETGLYGATGAMRVWSAMFARLPSAPLQVGDKGLDWQWVVGNNTTDADCAGARRIPFVAGFAPQYAPCPMPQPEAEEGGGWREWFGLGRDDEEQPEEAAPPPDQQ
jgi:penicillin-binding protein 1B